METKEDIIKDISQKLLRIINKHSRIEELPVHFGEGVEATPREIHTIQAIGEHKPINVTDLGSFFGVTKSAASQIVSKLAEKGFVEKGYTSYSNKELELSLTELGWRAFHAHERIHGKHMADILDHLCAFSLEQIATTSVLLDVIENVLDERTIQLLKK